MIARDIMTVNVITVGPDENLEKAAQMLVDNKISGIPVVDEEHRVLGIISEKDLMIKAGELKVPFYITLFDSIIFLENPMRLKNDLKKYTASKVAEAMTRKVITVDEETPVTEIVRIMQDKKVNRVPVVKDGRLVGIISRNDILKTMVKRNG